MKRKLRQGELVIYRKTKHSTRPGPRAIEIHPASSGDAYLYNVDKFWIVAEVRPDGKVVIRTRRGKEHLLADDDPALRKATWWERLVYKGRFPVGKT